MPASQADNTKDRRGIQLVSVLVGSTPATRAKVHIAGSSRSRLAHNPLSRLSADVPTRRRFDHRRRRVRRIGRGRERAIATVAVQLLLQRRELLLHLLELYLRLTKPAFQVAQPLPKAMIAFAQHHARPAAFHWLRSVILHFLLIPTRSNWVKETERLLRRLSGYYCEACERWAN
jgi:hypothetical protein